MITIISGTNRAGSKTREVAEYCRQYLDQSSDEEIQFITLDSLPMDLINPDMYTADGQSEDLTLLQDQYLVPADKWLILTPEYNGGFAGILKLFIDAISIRRYKETFKSKYVGLIGVSSGRAGNLRGLDQLTANLNYLGMHIHPLKLPISSIGEVIQDGKINKETKSAINTMLDGFVASAIATKVEAF